VEPVALLITALVGAVSALGGAWVAIHRFPSERRQAEAETVATWTEAQAVVITNLREENRQQRVRLDTYQAAVEALQKSERDNEKRIRDLERDLKRAKVRIKELEACNRKLEQENADLRQFYQQANGL